MSGQFMVPMSPDDARELVSMYDRQMTDQEFESEGISVRHEYHNHQTDKVIETIRHFLKHLT